MHTKTVKGFVLGLIIRRNLLSDNPSVQRINKEQLKHAGY